MNRTEAPCPRELKGFNNGVIAPAPRLPYTSRHP